MSEAAEHPERRIGHAWRKRSSELATVVDEVVVSVEQRETFLGLLRENKSLGLERALREAGVAGTKGQLSAWLAQDSEIAEQARLARGWNLNSVEGVVWEVALDSDHKHWDRASTRVLKAYHPAYRDVATVEHEHVGTVTVEHERRLTLNDVVGLARELAGSGDGVVDVVPATRTLLPAPEDGVASPGGVPPRRP